MMGNKPLKGFFSRAAQGQLLYEIDTNSDLLFKLAEVLVSNFGFRSIGAPLDGIDVIYWDFARDELKVTLGWDIWSGCFIMATNADCDEVVQSIGQYLEKVLHEL